MVLILEGGPASPKPPVKAVLDQRDTRFDPEIVIVPTGSTVEFPNWDPIFHNVFSLSKTQPFDLGFYPKGQSRTVKFNHPGIVQVYCHIHANMYAAIIVTSSPWYAKPSADGCFFLARCSGGPLSAQRVAQDRRTLSGRKWMSRRAERQRSRSRFPWTWSRGLEVKTSLTTRAFYSRFCPSAPFWRAAYRRSMRWCSRGSRSGLRDSLEKSEELLARADEDYSRRTNQFVSVFGGERRTEGGHRSRCTKLVHYAENAAEIRHTIEAQLREMHSLVGYDLLAITDWKGRTLAAVAI